MFMQIIFNSVFETQMQTKPSKHRTVTQHVT